MVCRWIALFDREPQMKQQMYDTYLRGYSRLLDGLFLMRSYRRFVQTLAAFEDEYETIGSLNGNAKLISRHILYANRMNRHFWEGTFAEGVDDSRSRAVPPRLRVPAEHSPPYGALL